MNEEITNMDAKVIKMEEKHSKEIDMGVETINRCRHRQGHSKGLHNTGNNIQN